MKNVLEPACRYGFTREQVEQIAAEKIGDFDHFMRGQTVALCDDHGVVVYGCDVDQWIAGGDPLD